MSDASNIVSCPCGINIRLPENAKQRILRCPKCKRGLPLRADSTLLTSTVWAGSAIRTICPICQVPIDAGEEVVTCPDCKRTHHTECWAEVGGCGMYGCRQAFPTDKTADPNAMAQSQNAVWENERTPCPVCREVISQAATACPFCKTPLRYHAGRMIPNLSGKSQDQSLRTTTIVLFVASFVGCFAPLIAIVSGILFWRKRKQLARTGQIYLIMTLLSLGISSLFCVIMLGFLLFGGIS